MADSVQLIVNVEVWLHNLVTEQDKADCVDHYPAAELRQQAEDEDQVCHLTEDVPKAMEDCSVEDMNIL